MQTPNQPNGQPFRPPSEKDLVQLANGRANFLGVIRSTGTAVDNASTVAPAPPFLFTPAGPAPTTTPFQTAQNLAGTLAAKMLFLQPSAAGFGRASATAISTPGTVTVATQTLPVVLGTEPGIAITTSGVVTTQNATDGFYQWISLTGTADLYVWELL